MYRTISKWAFVITPVLILVSFFSILVFEKHQRKKAKHLADLFENKQINFPAFGEVTRKQALDAFYSRIIEVIPEFREVEMIPWDSRYLPVSVIEGMPQSETSPGNRLNSILRARLGRYLFRGDKLILHTIRKRPEYFSENLYWFTAGKLNQLDLFLSNKFPNLRIPGVHRSPMTYTGPSKPWHGSFGLARWFYE